MIRAAVLTLGLLLAGCATGPGLPERMEPLMGAPQLEVVRALGVPDAQTEADGVRILRWSSRSVRVYPGAPWWVHRGLGGPPPVVVQRRCDLEIEFTRRAAAGPWRAVSWRTRGNDCR
jgi:hypothetical protein